MPLALGAQSLNHWTTREVPILLFSMYLKHFERTYVVQKGLRSLLLVQRCSYLVAHYSHSQVLNAFSESLSVVSDSFRPHGLYSPWNSLARILEWVAFPFSRGSS